MPGLRAAFEPPAVVRSDFAATLYVTEWEGTAELRLVYRAAAYSAERMRILLAQLAHLLAQSAQDPARPLAAYDLSRPAPAALPPDTTAPLPAPPQESVPDTIARWAALTPDAPALRQGTETLSYAAMVAWMDAITARLRDSGLAKGEVVAVRGPRSPSLIVAMAAVLRAGGVLLTLSLDLPPERQQAMLTRAGARRLLRAGPERGRTPGCWKCRT